MVRQGTRSPIDPAAASQARCRKKTWEDLTQPGASVEEEEGTGATVRVPQEALVGWPKGQVRSSPRSSNGGRVASRFGK